MHKTLNKDDITKICTNDNTPQSFDPGRATLGQDTLG